jgi:hypothetical protein
MRILRWERSAAGMHFGGAQEAWRQAGVEDRLSGCACLKTEAPHLAGIQSSLRAQGSRSEKMG